MIFFYFLYDLYLKTIDFLFNREQEAKQLKIIIEKIENK